MVDDAQLTKFLEDDLLTNRMTAEEVARHLIYKLPIDNEYLSLIEETIEQERKNTIKEEQLRIAQAIFDLWSSEVTEFEALDRECPEDNPTLICVHDVRAITFNVLYDVMRKQLGFAIQMVNGVDHLVKD